MSLIDKFLSVIAPHDCLSCGKEGLILCAVCLKSIPNITPRCFICLREADGWNTCPKCLEQFPINKMFIVKEYTPKSKALVWKLKNDGLQESARIMAQEMAKILPKFNKLLIVPAPTSNRRRRQRGYDQARLVARELQRLTGHELVNSLRRKGEIHQVGADVVTRKQQLQNSFELSRPSRAKNRRILLVDDVVTTGATLASAAQTLLEAGASEVWAVCFAHPKLKNSR